MQTGAFALIDALGFKGIWKRHGEEQVLAKLRWMEKKSRESVELDNTAPDPYGAPGLFGPRRASFLSDSIAMGAELGAIDPDPDPNLTPAGRAITWLTLHVSILLRSAAVTDPPLAYRGCISFGAFVIDGPFILGPAVDEAARWHGEAEGAFVWLDEAAKSILESQPIAREPSFPEKKSLLRVSVPLKQGRKFDTFAVLPYGVGYRAKEHVNTRLLSSFENAVDDVSAKRENTRAFLEAGRAASDAAFHRLDRRLLSRITDNGLDW